MAYQTKLDATEMDSFAELFEIATPETTYFYTSYQTDLTFQSQLYEKRPILRGELSFSDRLSSKVKISAPLSDAFLAYIASFSPDQTVVKITRVFLPDMADYVQLFLGHIIGITIENKVAHADCESETRLLRNKIPKILFQAWCNHMLFDSDCGLNEASYAVAVSVSSVSDGARIISPTLGTYAEQYFSLGYCKFNNDLRFIENHYTPEGDVIPTTIKIQFPFNGLLAGSNIICYPGCDKSYETCLNKFNNVSNRLAFDNIPSQNPVVWGGLGV